MKVMIILSALLITLVTPMAGQAPAAGTVRREGHRLLGDMVNTIRPETAKVTENANRPDAGKMTYRRFTEIWILRNGAWKKVVCHANHLDSG